MATTVAREVYLADTSVMARMGKSLILNAVAGFATSGSVALCSAVLFELGYGARSPGDYTELMFRLSSYTNLPTSEGNHRRALEIQAALAQVGRHRALSPVDALVAAVAESRGLTILHYDADFELIASVTGQAQTWVVPRGSAD